MPMFQFSSYLSMPSYELFNTQLDFNNFNNFDNFTLSNPIKVSKAKSSNINTRNTFSGQKLKLSTEELCKMGFDTKEKRDGWNSLKPEMQNAVYKLTKYAESQGIKITYGSKRSIFRTYAEQSAIYKSARKGFAAKPGNSRHESGEAVDITIPGANKNDKNDPKYKKLAQYWENMGYTWGGTWNHCEPWHFDLRAKA